MSKIKVKCKTCGKQCFVSDRRKKDTGNYCSSRCVGKAFIGSKSPVWKGGKLLLENGYVHTTIPDNHPLKLEGYRYIAEHRLVMEKAIGRPLTKYELVHHLNGNKTDNRLENLVLCTRRNHYEFIRKLQNRIKELERNSTSISL